MRTPDAEILPPGTVRSTVGFDFLQDVTFPLSGLSGDLTSVGVLQTRVSVGKMIEIQIEQAVHHFLTVKQQAGGAIVPALTGPNTTHDWGDLSLFTKVRFISEARGRPALAFRFGFSMPNANQARGVGTNTLNLFAGLILQKHVGRLNLYGTLGMAILESPTANFTQNDVLTYGGAAIFKVNERLSLAGEIAGRYSSRAIGAGLVGTESRSEARFGVQIFAGGFQWDVAGIAGLTRRDANTGFTFGISKDLRLFDYGKVK